LETVTFHPAIKPRMCSVDFENHPGDLGTAAIVLADAPGAAPEKTLKLFP
jgi:hypothetical protein